MSPQRLDAARERIDAICAEYNYFNPTCYLTNSSVSTISCAEEGHYRCFHAPEPGQLRTDLQLLFERFLVLESEAADNAYKRISLVAMEMAGDEYSGFDWEMLKGIIEYELEELAHCGYHVDVLDLAYL